MRIQIIFKDSLPFKITKKRAEELQIACRCAEICVSDELSDFIENTKIDANAAPADRMAKLAEVIYAKLPKEGNLTLYPSGEKVKSVVAYENTLKRKASQFIAERLPRLKLSNDAFYECIKFNYQF